MPAAAGILYAPVPPQFGQQVAHLVLLLLAGQHFAELGEQQFVDLGARRLTEPFQIVGQQLGVELIVLGAGTDVVCLAGSMR